MHITAGLGDIEAQLSQNWKARTREILLLVSNDPKVHESQAIHTLPLINQSSCTGHVEIK
jgi:hypothetical protein